MLFFYKPKNEILAKYIEGYYFLKSNANDFSLSYYTFPNNFQIVSCTLQTEIEISKSHLIAKFNKGEALHSTFTYHYFAPIQIDYLGQINELTVYFKPLGLNHFVENIGSFYKNKGFIPFCPFDDFQEKMKQILRLEDIDEAIEMLEDYWLGKLSEKKFEKIFNIISMIDTMTVDDISDTLQISRQYLHKTFKAHTGKSLIAFKRIQRFRNALGFPQANLTQIGMESLFYDQSHFIREIHKLTNTSPKVFFKNLEFQTANPWFII